VVIEELTGLRYQDYVEQVILKAAGMHRSGFFAFNQLPEKTALGYIEEEGSWRTNIYNLPIVGASDGGAYTTIDDLANLWKAFWENRILPRELVELYVTPYVKAGGEGKHKYYGQGLWINQEAKGLAEVYMTGCDAGVSFWSGVRRDADLNFTVLSNTTDGAWPVLRDIKSAVK
jgi:CubicO group peptidase (beta-lactamase class C family)